MIRFLRGVEAGDELKRAYQGMTTTVRHGPIDAIGRGAVPNALLTDTPLVTVPDATIDGMPVEVAETSTDGGVSNTPPPITDGLPTPSTH